MEYVLTCFIQKYGTPFPAIRANGHNLWPLKFVTQLYYLAKPKIELNLHTRTPVTSVHPITNLDSPRRWDLTTHRGSIKSSYIIHATNGYASHLLPHMHGPSGIIPTRGQIIAVRAKGSLDSLGKSSWDANEGFEYWFPRPVMPTSETQNPLVILGGGREASSSYELYETDDSALNVKTSKALKDFLPSIFRLQYEKGRDPEMEWVRF